MKPDLPPEMPAGTLNFRDLGGLRTRDGRSIRAGQLFRAGAFHDLTPDDAQRLYDDFGIRFVVDLRGSAESALEGRGGFSEFAVCHMNFPLLDFSYLLDLDDVEVGGETLMPRYLDNLDSDPNLVFAVDFVAHALIRAPVVLHCAFGKDRTGTVVALILGLVGVTDDAIVADYMESGPHAKRFVEVARQIPRYKPYAERDTEVFRSNEETIRTFLSELERRHGGATSWALSKGIHPETISRLERVLVEH